MSQVGILKRTMVVVFLAGMAAGLLAPRGTSADAATSAFAVIDHGAVSTPAPAPVAPAQKSPLRVLPADVTPATAVAVVGLRAKV